MTIYRPARDRRTPVLAAIFAAGLAVLSAGCGSSPALSAGSPATPSRTTAAPSGTTAAPSGTTAPAPVTATAQAATAGPGTGPAVRPAPPAVDTHIKAYGNCTTPAVEPAEIVLACADYGALLDGLHWTSWTASSATAVGVLEYNDCTPSCADGHHHDVPGTRVTLTVPVPRGGQLLWSRIQESPQPPGYATGPDHGGPQQLPLGPA